MANAALVAHLRRSAAQPVTDAARDDLTERLNVAFTAGDLDADSYRQLLADTFAAQTMADLVPVAERLPKAPVSNLPEIVAQRTRPGELAPIKTGRAVGRRIAVVATPAVVIGVGVLVLLAHLLHLF